MSRGSQSQPSSVDYSTIDPFKVEAQRLAALSDVNIARLGLEIVRATRGESALVVEATSGRAIPLFGGVVETLGTKSLVADEVGHNGRYFYDTLAQDTVAMIVNDAATMGLIPVIVGQLLLVGSSDWFTNYDRALELVQGWANACDLARCVYGPGETAAISGVVNDDCAAISGFALGILPTFGSRIRGNVSTGDAIVLFESAGIHANGLTNARALAASLPEGYKTKLDSGRSYGEALLDPTLIYSPVVEDVLMAGIEVHYAVHVTGHGWRKLMRASEQCSYVIDVLPDVPEVLSFIVDRADMSLDAAYGTFNMGAGFALYVPEDSVESVIEIAADSGIRAWRGGRVVGGRRRVVLDELGVTFEGESLQLR